MIRYNENDCKLTMRLWQHLVRRKPLCIGEKTARKIIPAQSDIVAANNKGSNLYVELREFFASAEFKFGSAEIVADDKDITYLTGKKSQFTYREWQKNIQANGHAFKVKSARPPYSEVVDPELKAGGKPVFHRFYCVPCGRRLFFVTDMHRTFSERDTVECPECGTKQPVLGPGDGSSTLRSGMGPGDIYVLQKNEAGMLLFAQVQPPYDPVCWVEAKKARKFIREMR